MKQERNRKLFKDIIIYGIGNIGSRFLALLLIPLFTFYLEREELGYYNVALATILFLIPIITLQMRESTFRFLIDSDDAVYKKEMLSTTFFLEGILFFVLFIVSLCMSFFVNIPYFWLIIISIYMYSFYEIYLQVVRVLYSATKFALMGIITSLLTVVFSVVLLLVFDRGIEGLFIANIFARLIAMACIELPQRKFLQTLSCQSVRKTYIREILTYCLPMMMTAVSAGMITISGIYLVKALLGVEENGDLGVAEKFVTIIQILGVTFYQAWQVTAVKNFRKESSRQFFSEVFNKYAVFLSLLVIVISFGLRSFSFLLIDEKYIQSVHIVFIYAAGGMFYCFALFLEITFQCTKQTSKILYSTVSCALLTPLLAYLLIMQYGLIGNVIAIFIAYAYLFLFRYFQTQSILPIRLHKDFYVSLFLLIVAGALFYGTDNTILDYLVTGIAGILLLYFLFISRKYIH